MNIPESGRPPAVPFRASPDHAFAGRCPRWWI